MKLLKLSRGLFAKVDDADFEWLNAWKWTFMDKGNGAVAAYRPDRSTGKQVNIYLHRFIMDAPKGMVVDHINHDPLDNRRENLRVCTIAENCRNQRRKITSTSGVKGVYWDKATKKWTAHITFNYKTTHLGLFKNKKDAAKAYAEAAERMFGKYAFID